MRAGLERKLNGIWYGGGPPPWWLRALTPLYRLLFRFHRWRQMRRRPADLERRCIIVVGNLTAGGSGKTPLLVRICEILKNAGLKPGVVSRGYGRIDKRQRLVSTAARPEEVGDEPLLIARRTGAPVMVGRDRVRCARALFAHGADVAISDDGLQHHRLPRSIEICLVDGQRGFGNGCLLPAGPLREPVARLHTVDHVVVNGAGFGMTVNDIVPDGIEVVPMEVTAKKVQSLNGRQNWLLSQFRGCRAHAVAGIADPRRFFDLLRAAGIEVSEHAFSDHHPFSEKDFLAMRGDLPIIMTEKDAVKCVRFKLDNAWYLTIAAQLPADWERELLGQVLGAVKGKRASS